MKPLIAKQANNKSSTQRITAGLTVDILQCNIYRLTSIVVGVVVVFVVRKRNTLKNLLCIKILNNTPKLSAIDLVVVFSTLNWFMNKGRGQRK